MDGAFFRPEGDAFEATPLTRGPWDNRFQHGGPPAALLGGAMARHGDDAGDFAMARITLELLRPVPITRLRVAATMARAGRTAQRLEARLFAGDDLLVVARGVRLRRCPVAAPALPAEEAWPTPDALEPFVFPFFRHEVGYHRAIDLRVARGAWGTTPVAFWARSTVPLVDGRETLPVERALILVDAQSGMGPPADPADFTFVNPDLTLYLAREPHGDWLGLDIRSGAGPEGCGLSESALRDVDGPVGRSAQALVMAPRAP